MTITGEQSNGSVRGLSRLVLALILLTSTWSAAQDLGHKMPGAVGVDAGVVSGPGLYVADRVLWYSANRIVDRTGQPVPVEGIDLDAVGNALGVLGTLKLTDTLHLSASASAPLARIATSSDDPRSSADRFGLGDAYVMPLQLGWRLQRFDVLGSYGVYIPTGQFEPERGGEGIGRGHWTQQFSVGGAVYFDAQRRGRASFLVSYDLNFRKRDVDIIRGDTAQIQGGAGVLLWRFLDVGVAGYALWQVRDHRGADVPVILRGARDRVFGVGPEVNVLIPRVGMRVGARYEWDVAARSRPEGRLLVISLTWAAWRPATPKS